MTTDTLLNDAELRRRAKKRVGMKTGFYIHLLVFVCVNLGLVALNLLQGGHRWSIWPLGGWAIGLAVHGLVVFLSMNSDGLRERMLNQEIERLKARR